jgi:molybdate transport system regulatory protein
MNTLPGVIYKVQSAEGITLVDICIDNDQFSSLIINSESTDAYIKEGNKVNMLFKETEISLKRYHDKLVKRQNKVIAEVTEILNGKILSQVKLKYKEHNVTAIVLTRLLNELALEEGKKAVMILRTQEILLSRLIIE